MSTVPASEVLAARVAQFKQKQEGRAAPAQVYIPETQPIIVKPMASSWEDLEQKLKAVINLPGLWVTVGELYDQGYGAQLETAAEIALAVHKKESPCNLFAKMVSKKSGNWFTKTLQKGHEAWEIRRNALQVMERLNLAATTAKKVLSIAWRLKGSIMHYLGLATEQGTGIKNPAGVFFSLTKQFSKQRVAAA
jgi:hypothetical protein